MQSLPTQSVDIRVFPPFTRRVTRTWLRGVAQQALYSCCGGANVGVSLVIADDETVRDLNREYRGLDESTDVLAFSLNESQVDGEPAGQGFNLPPEESTIVGEVIISYPQAVRQAREQRKPVKAEMALLVVHGVLHLLGYDHAEPDQERRMWDKQAEILARVPLA